MGGEPLINPEWQQWVLGVRKLMPTAQIRFTTNGLLLSRYPDIVDFFNHVGNVVFKISVHVNRPDLEDQIAQIQNKHAWHAVTEFGIQRWKTGNNLRLQINRPQWFYKTFVGDYDYMLPHNSVPAQAFEICVQKKCPLLYQGRIFKCSTSALTGDVINRFSNVDREAWAPYQDSGIDYTCDDTQLNEFIGNFGRPHKICAQCPSKDNLSSRLHHFSTVSVK